MGRKLKILHTEASCGWGGQEIRILEESSGLMARGHEVVVACPEHSRIFAEADRYGIRTVALPIEFKTFGGLWAIRRHLQGRQYDVVNTHSSADSWLVALACASLSKPPRLVRTRHISAPVSGNPANRWLYGRFRFVVTTGESIRRHLIEILALDARAVCSIPTGVDPMRFRPTSGPERDGLKAALGLSDAFRYIGIVATLRSWKGHLYLIDALARLVSSDVHLVIVGEGPMREPIEQRILDLGLSERVFMTGQRMDPELWLQAIDVFCLPSYANEGVPQALLQAMCSGLPIVTTPVGAISEVVSDGEDARLVPPRDTGALATALDSLLGDPHGAALLGASARRRASTLYSRDHMLDRMEDVFGKAISHEFS